MSHNVTECAADHSNPKSGGGGADFYPQSLSYFSSGGSGNVSAAPMIQI